MKQLRDKVAERLMSNKVAITLMIQLNINVGMIKHFKKQKILLMKSVIQH